MREQLPVLVISESSAFWAPYATRLVRFGLNVTNVLPSDLLYNVKPADASEKEDGLETVKLALLFGAWYLANIYFNMCVSLMIHRTVRICSIRVPLTRGPQHRHTAATTSSF